MKMKKSLYQWTKLCVDLKGIYNLCTKIRPKYITKVSTITNPITEWFQLRLIYNDKKVMIIMNIEIT